MADTKSGSPESRPTSPADPDITVKPATQVIPETAPEPAPAAADGYEAQTLEWLKTEAERLDVTSQIEATGANGHVVKADVIRAIQTVAAEDTSGRDDLAAVAARRTRNRNVRVVGTQEA